MLDFSKVKAQDSQRSGVRTLFCVGMVSTAFLCLSLMGCKKRTAPAPNVPEVSLPGVITNRMADAAYRAALADNRREQMRLAGERSEIVAKMQGMVDRARAKLPAGADDAAVKAELAKDPEWGAHEASNQVKVVEIQNKLSMSRELARQRMLAEARDVKAVAEGKARAVDPQQTKTK